MAAPLTALSDGSAAAIAIVRWLRSHDVHAKLFEGRSPGDVGRLVRARSGQRSNERLVVLTPSTDDIEIDIDGSEALRVASRWLKGLAPIERRAATDRIESQRLAHAEGYEAFNELLRLCKAGDLRIERGKRGRPKGTNPFAGVGADVLIAMLVTSEHSWSERELASAVDRSPSAVHKVLVELRKRGYLQRRRGETRLVKPLVLRDDLLAAWRGKVSDRVGIVLSCPRRQGPRDLIQQLQKEGHRIVLSGVSALAMPDAPIESIVSVYAEASAQDALVRLGCEPSSAGMGNLAVWEPVERGVFYMPNAVEGVQASNRVVTYLDVATGKSARHQRAAEVYWERSA